MQRKTDSSAAGRQAIVVMGVSGSGKSTLAALLADKLGCAFFEGDSFHSPANVEKMRHGEPLTDEDRWPWLDHLGAAIGAAVEQEGLAVSACSALRRAYRDRLCAAIKAPVLFVLLEANREELVRRLGNRPGHYMPPSLLDSQLATLEKPAEDEDAMTLESSLPPEELAEQVMARLALSDRATRRAG